MITPELAAALAQSRSAIAAGTGDGYDHMILALGAQAQGQSGEAEALFERALALSPGDPSVLTGYAKFLREAGRLSEGLRACDAALAITTQYPDAWIERGAILGAGGSSRAASESYARAIALNPGATAAHAGLAAIAAREGDADSARHHGSRALALDPANAIAASALATVALEEGCAEEAVSLLEPVIAARPEPSFDRSLAAGFLGDARHRLGQHEAAFAAYSLCKADFAAIHAHRDPDRMRHRAFVEAIHDGLSAMEVTAPSARAIQPPSAARRHVFLLGYPRSGTTLMENVLASLPGAAALEERPTLQAVDEAVLSGDAETIIARLAAFAQAPEEEVDDFRQAYWRKVTEAGVPAGAGLFIDMDPLKATRLPLIQRLFPDARVLIMRRDPRDVVWSCFKTQFAMTSGTLDYTTLEDTARHYDAMMRLTELARSTLPIHAMEVRYDQLVRDFEATTRAVCAFIGMDWSDAVLRFDRTARERGVATASVGQVRKGLYDGTRQWEPYARWLEPVLPILQPWIDRFGYA
ncbi:MAG: tetratricopeptide repeat-containing sulfotransferase family protein [Novosphingobium sp.]